MNKNKISVYMKNEELLQDIKLLTIIDNVTLTEIVEKALLNYAQERKSDLDKFYSAKLNKKSEN